MSLVFAVFILLILLCETIFEALAFAFPVRDHGFVDYFKNSLWVIKSFYWEY